MVPGVNFANSTDGEHSRWVVGASDGEFSLTWTGNSLIARLALLSCPARYSLRQPNTWLALTLCDSATRATDAPSTKVSSTIRRFSSIGRYCRLGKVPLRPLTVMSSVACVEVSISAPSGHDPYVCPQRTRMSCSHTSVQTVTSVRLHRITESGKGRVGSEAGRLS